MGGGGGGKEVGSTFCGRRDGRKKELEVKIILRRGPGGGGRISVDKEPSR